MPCCCRVTGRGGQSSSAEATQAEDFARTGAFLCLAGYEGFAYVGLAAARQPRGSSTERSQPAAEPLNATAPFTACAAELAQHSRGIRQHTPHSTPAFPCRESQAEHSTAEPRGLRRSHTTTELTAAEDSEGKDRRRRGRAAGTEQGRTRTGLWGGRRDGPRTRLPGSFLSREHGWQGEHPAQEEP